MDLPSSVWRGVPLTVVAAPLRRRPTLGLGAGDKALGAGDRALGGEGEGAL